MTVSETFIAKETGNQRKPAELYHIWRGTSHWYHTNMDSAITYDSQIYQPATIQREEVSFNSDMKVSEVRVDFAKTDPAIAAYLANTPVDLSWISIQRLFLDQDPAETLLVFFGQILNVSLKGLAASATCGGIEYLLKQSLLRFRYQPECNHTLFDAKCGLTSSAYAISPTVTVDATRRVLTAAAFGVEADGYWTLGTVQYGDDIRSIVAHEGNNIALMYPFGSSLITGETVTVLPGCDGDIDTCQTKFGNLNHFFGFPFIPLDNPATWVGR